MNNEKVSFNPLLFLSSLGAGGIAIIPFAFFQYTHHQGTGLIQLADLDWVSQGMGQNTLFLLLMGIMVVFSLLHMGLTGYHIHALWKWLGSDEQKEMLADPLKNSGIMAPIITLTMTMNVCIGPVRFFWSPMANNLQSLMLPAFLFWSLLWVIAIATGIYLLRTAFITPFDTTRIHFGWLLQPFALGMVTVTGTGIAAMAHNSALAHGAALMSMITGTMGFFLLFTQINTIFKSQFAAKGLADKQLLPSYLIIVPNITLYAISLFRFGHYLAHHHDMDVSALSTILLTAFFGFETWFLLFGLTLIGSSLGSSMLKGEFYITQWGLICPVVAYGVLASFMYSVFYSSLFFSLVAVMSTMLAVSLFLLLLYRQSGCSGIFPRNGLKDCLNNS